MSRRRPRRRRAAAVARPFLAGAAAAAMTLAGAPAGAAPRGADLFARAWPAIPGPGDRAGPLLNARSCAACHDGGPRDPDRSPLTAGAAPPPGAGPGPALVLRLAPGTAYGLQLQTRARAGVPGLGPEGRVEPAAEEAVAVPLAGGGGEALLRRRRWAIADGAHGAPPAGEGVSARLAPPLLGLGWLARIPDAEILGNRARSGGRPGGEAGGSGRPGRFGLKARHATLEAQVAAALARDMGLATPALPDPAGDCTPAQPACRAAEPAGAAPAVDAAGLAALAAFAGAARPAPAPPSPDPAAAARGAGLFEALGCAACHRPSYGLAADPRLEGTAGTFEVRPYTDLLLHDLGGGLADGVADGAATGREWRTAPLWGLGARLARGDRLLHDGRARDALEAVLWHGGAAAPARDGAAALPAAERAALLSFLAGL